VQYRGASGLRKKYGFGHYESALEGKRLSARRKGTLWTYDRASFETAASQPSSGEGSGRPSKVSLILRSAAETSERTHGASAVLRSSMSGAVIRRPVLSRSSQREDGEPNSAPRGRRLSALSAPIGDGSRLGALFSAMTGSSLAERTRRVAASSLSYGAAGRAAEPSAAAHSRARSRARRGRTSCRRRTIMTVMLGALHVGVRLGRVSVRIIRALSAGFRPGLAPIVAAGAGPGLVLRATARP